MKLLIDIGNTNTSIALVIGKKIKRRYLIHTNRKELKEALLKRLFKPDIYEISEIVIVSVVPGFLSILKRSLKKTFPTAKIFVVGKDLKVPIKNKYKNPSEVGQDRLVTAFAASKIYGSPVLSIDFGTAVTFDFVNKKGEYEGGLIIPGLRLALTSLVKNTALLPSIELKNVKGLIGKDTKGSMNKGILYGYASMCDGIIEKFRKSYSKKLKVVATGGDAELIAKYSRHLKIISNTLLFKGLNLIKKST